MDKAEKDDFRERFQHIMAGEPKYFTNADLLKNHYLGTHRRFLVNLDTKLHTMVERWAWVKVPRKGKIDYFEPKSIWDRPKPWQPRRVYGPGSSPQPRERKRVMRHNYKGNMTQEEFDQMYKAVEKSLVVMVPLPTQFDPIFCVHDCGLLGLGGHELLRFEGSQAPMRKPFKDLEGLVYSPKNKLLATLGGHEILQRRRYQY